MIQCKNSQCFNVKKNWSNLLVKNCFHRTILFKIRHKTSTLRRIPLQLLLASSEPKFFCFQFLKCFCSFKVCETCRFRTILLFFFLQGKICSRFIFVRISRLWIFTVSIKRQTWAELHESQAKEMIKRSYFQELRP